jgi:biopolymer transport protein ExbB
MKTNHLRHCCLIVIIVLFSSGIAFAAQGREDVTLWQTLVGGGWVMLVIGLLSLVAVALISYDVMTLNEDKLVSRKFFDQIMRKLDAGDLHGVREMCLKEKNNIIAKMVLAGLNKAKNLRDPLVKEAMEQRARIEIGNLWQNLNYLSDIIAVAPLLGLLGTVLGMIQAFQAIPVQTAGVKMSLLVAGISKAMITTASGLIVAIPVLMAYSYFRGQVTNVTNMIEVYATDIIKKFEQL